jgi:ComF family protein
MDLVASFKDAVLNLAFPQVCHVCQDRVYKARFGVACSHCWSQTRFIADDQVRCQKCGIPGTAPNLISADCPNCRDHQYDLVRSLGLYEKAISASILHLKRVPVIPRTLIGKLHDMLAVGDFSGVDVIVPVPLSNKRRFERGFNQAETISRELSRILDVPADSTSLIRKKHTPMHRVAMDKKAREMTVTNAFEVVRPKLIAGRAVLLVDDIFTSGATASFCAKALKKKGAESVKVFTLARAL